ncbi:MAG: hypothetical protein H6745_13475 [Deltaproteobacteria bacterium]|nr:hypothetical protein [Deltaproteobacteria bacterium]
MSALRVAAAALLVALAPGARAGAATPLETAREARAAVLATALPSVADAPTVNELRGAFIAALNEESRLHGALEEAYLRATAAAPEAEQPAILVELLEVELALAKRMQTAARELLQPNAELVRMREPLVVYVREKAARVQKGLARCPEAVAACAGVRRELAALSGASAPEEDVARCVLATPLRGGRVFADAAGKQPIGTIAAELPATLAPAARRGGASEVRVAALEGPVWIPGGGGYVLRRELDVVAGGFVALRHGAPVTLSRASDGEVVVRADLGPGATPRRVEAKLACEDLVAAPLAVLGGGIGAGGGQVALKPGTPLYDAPGGKRVAVLGFREAGERGGVATAMRQEGAWVSVVGGTTSLAFHGWVKSAAARPWSWGPAGHEDNAPRAELARPPEPTRVFTPAVEPLPLRLSATGPIVARAARAALVRVTERTETALTLEIKGLEAANADGRFIVRLADLEGAR